MNVSRRCLVWRKVVRIEMLCRSQNSCSRALAFELYVWDTYKHTYHKEAVLQIEVNERERRDHTSFRFSKAGQVRGRSIHKLFTEGRDRS